jgi:hypothetical protein
MEDLGVDGRMMLKEGVDWIFLSQDRVQGKGLVYTNESFGSLRAGNFMNRCPTLKCAVGAVGRPHGDRCLQLRLQNMKPQTVEPGNMVSVERVVGRQNGRLFPVLTNSAVHELIAIRVLRPGRFRQDAHAFGQVR